MTRTFGADGSFDEPLVGCNAIPLTDGNRTGPMRVAAPVVGSML